MQITSLSFVLFTFLLFVVYYLLPKRFQWVVLLLASVCFYLLCGAFGIIYVIITSITIYLSTLAMTQLSNNRKTYIKNNKEQLSKQEKKEYKAKNKNKRRLILVSVLLINFGVLVVLKYSHFFVEQINGIFATTGLMQLDNSFKFIVPLGISYYTLQSTGYAIDVFREKYEAERNPFKVFLFVSFFPQMTQGPISDYGVLSAELFRDHSLKYENFSFGFRRMIWGFFKKMAIADVLSPYVSSILSDYNDYTGITLLIGAILYMIQMYADFSGYMDIMCGYCEMLDIKLTENFNRPFFSKSVSEFWRRWHISLGAWLRNYVYYPTALSKWCQKISNRLRNKIGLYASGLIPTTIALFFVWLFIGLWHDASWAYVLWGLGNAFFIILSTWLDPFYTKTKKRLHIKETSIVFNGFKVVRTFFIIVFLEVMAAVQVKDGSALEYIIHIFTKFKIPLGLSDLIPISESITNTEKIALFIAIAGMLLMLFVSLYERKNNIRNLIKKIPLILRIIILVLVTLVICLFGVQASWGTEAFMYANF